MNITVRIKNVYGNDLIYPVDEAAHTFARLTNKKTLSNDDIEQIKQLGYAVNVEQPQL